MPAILDAHGHKMKPSEPVAQMTKAIVFVSSDGESWEPMPPYNVPEAVKDPDMMGCMLAGEILESSDGRLFKAERLQ